MTGAPLGKASRESVSRTFDLGLYQEEYMAALKDEKAGTMLGMFFDAAIRQKNMVAREIFISKNPLAGIFSKKLSDIIAMSS